jgi:quinol-cytochrome oxidoreductase complex cytochrome b subunit
MMQNIQQIELENPNIQSEITNKYSWNIWNYIFFWIGILVLFAFLGFNIFNYLVNLHYYPNTLLNHL